MKRYLYFLGSGSECNYQYPRRKNTSLILELPKGNAIIDVGDAFPDNWNELRQTKRKLEFPSALVFTHPHLDHICSFRAFANYSKKENVQFKTFAARSTIKEIEKTFHWLTDKDFNKIKHLKNGESFQCLGEILTPFHLAHKKYDSLGFRFGKFAYISDFNGSITKKSLSIIQGAEIIIMECNNLDKKMKNHNNLETTIKLGREIDKNWKIKKLILTHLGDNFPNDKTKGARIIKERYSKEKFDIGLSYDFMKLEL